MLDVYIPAILKSGIRKCGISESDHPLYISDLTLVITPRAQNKTALRVRRLHEQSKVEKYVFPNSPL